MENHNPAIGTSIQDLHNLKKNMPYNYMQQPPINNTYTNNNQLTQDELDDMEELVKDINDNIPDESLNSEIQDNDDIEKYITSPSLHNDIKEYVMFMAIYIFLSQASVKLSLGNYIPQILPGDRGKVSMTGIIIYGSLILILFKLAKKYLP